MNTSELRINNFIELADKGVYQIYDAHYLVNIDSWGDLKYCSPIPLTEEWLLKFGFLKRDQFLVFYKKHFQVDFNIFSWETPVGQSNGVPAGEFYIIINGSIHVLNTVHQLQNLYFALTGSELALSTVPEATKPAL